MPLTNWLDTTLYPSYGDHWDNKRLRKRLEAAIEPDFTVLDYGAGRGALEEMNLRGLARKVAGVDIDEAVLSNPFLDEAKTLSPEHAEIPYPDDTFDLVFSNNVMEHVPDPERAMREIRRVLKPGGLLIGKTPNKMHYVPMVAVLTPHAFHTFFNRLRGQESHDVFPTLYRCNTPKRIEAVARAAGFESVDIEMWEGRPEYLRILAPLYLLGYVYERIVNSSRSLARFRCVIVFTLRKGVADHSS